jgi:hypothetical protein
MAWTTAEQVTLGGAGFTSNRQRLGAVETFAQNLLVGMETGNWTLNLNK